MEEDAEQETMLAWFRTYWNDLARFAWRSYVERGRGLLVLEGDWTDTVHAGYQTPKDATEHEQTWPDELMTAMEAYNPQTDIAFLIVRPSAVTVLAMASPPGCQTPYATGTEDGAPLLPSA